MLHAKFKTAGLTASYLEALVRPLVDEHGWSTDDCYRQLVEGLEGEGLPHLPKELFSAKGFAKRRFRAALADPLLSPARRDQLAEIQAAGDPDERRRLRLAAAARERRQAIAACSLCDQEGWTHASYGGPQVRCSHDSETGGW